MSDDDDDDHLGISARIDQLQMAKLMLSTGNYDAALNLLRGLRGKYADNAELHGQVEAMIVEAEAKAKGS